MTATGVKAGYYLETIWNQVGIVCEAQAEQPGAGSENICSQLWAITVLFEMHPFVFIDGLVF